MIIDRTHFSPVAAQPFTGMTLMVGAGAAVAVQLGLLRRIRLGPARLMLCGVGIVIVGNLIMTLARSYPLAALSFLITSAGYGFAMPAAAAGASLANHADHQGNVAGMIAAATGSGLLIAPVVVVLLYHHNVAYPLILIAGLALLILATVVPRCIQRLPDQADR